MEHGHSHSYFDQSLFMPHGHCYLWRPALLWTHFTSDLMIGLAYIAIALLLYALVKKIRLPFGPIFIAFGVFIGACGLTHFMEVWTIWTPDYWAAGAVKAVTAVASVATGVALHKLRPHITEFANSARLSEERRVQLESAHAQLETLYDKVKESDVLKTQFFANVSHELRTPLALILGPAEQVLSEGNLSESQKQSLDVILRNARTLLKQVNDLLDISKLEAGRMKPRYARSDLVKMFRYIAAHFETVMQSRSIFYSLHAPESIPAEFDPDKIQRVYMNLFSNAVKFVPDGGRIRVSIQQEGDAALFTIEDTGPGVSKELQDVIFERFRQGEGGVNRKVGGTGLGLAIVKDFVSMHGGTVRVVEGEAAGAKFEVRLPLRAPDGTAVVDDSRSMQRADDVALQGTLDELRRGKDNEVAQARIEGAPNVLVCEDNPDMNKFITDTLSLQFNVFRAFDGRQGLETARALRPDLIVSDIMMPYMSGDQLVEKVKSDEKLSSIPVLLLSARADDQMRVNLLRQGASDYLIKPFAAEELKARASNLLAIKKVRDVLERELETKTGSVVELVTEVAARKREAELAMEVAQAARAEAEKANEVKSAFLQLVSHELNTPLTAMNLTVQLLEGKESGSLTPTQKEMIDHLSSSSRQLKSLVSGLLEYVRANAERVARREPLDVNEVLSEVIRELEPVAKQKQLPVRFETLSSLREIETDREKVRTILSNLLVNALKFTEKGHVEVRVSQSSKETTIVIEDTGVGIQKADLERIFLPFEQLEPLRNKSIPGVGLGLALVKQLVESMGAKIEVTSEVGKGTLFTLRIQHA